MEALRAAPVAEGETVVSSVQVMSQTLSKNSSNSFLKNGGIKPVASSNSAASKEELREQLAAEAKAAVQDEIDELKKRTEEAEEKMERTQREMEDMKKLAEANQKAMEENNALLKRILSLNSDMNHCRWSVLPRALCCCCWCLARGLCCWLILFSLKPMLLVLGNFILLVVIM